MRSIDEQNWVDKFNAQLPIFLKMLGGRLLAVDLEAQSCTFEFNVSTDFCHSVDIVQGGFTTVMLDAAMSQAMFACEDNVKAVSSLEIKTSYLDVTRAGLLRAEGKIVKAGYKTAFLEGRLYNAEGVLSATASTVAKISRK
ncbi:MAG: PaaI family thioesterase [Halioglobus sp.]|nr:PaaI family thioesterase [Halioglobus sp.]